MTLVLSVLLFSLSGVLVAVWFKKDKELKRQQASLAELGRAVEEIREASIERQLHLERYQALLNDIHLTIKSGGDVKRLLDRIEYLQELDGDQT